MAVVYYPVSASTYVRRISGREMIEQYIDVAPDQIIVLSGSNVGNAVDFITASYALTWAVSMSLADYSTSASYATTSSYSPTSSFAIGGGTQIAIYTASNSSVRVSLPITQPTIRIGDYCFQTDNHQAYSYVSCSLTSSNPWKHDGGYPMLTSEDKFGGISTSSLIVWLRAEDLTGSYTDGQAIAIWPDAGISSSLPASQSTATSQPILRLKGGPNGYPRAVFCGQGNVSSMIINPKRVLGTSYSAFFVCRMMSATAMTLASDSAGNFQILTVAGLGGFTYNQNGGGNQSMATNNVFQNNFKDYYVFWITMVSGTPYFGQGERTLGNGAGGIPSFSVDTIGTYSTTQPLLGDITELAIFSTPQTGSNLTAITNYFMAKYDLIS